jgi:hypothetical protein
MNMQRTTSYSVDDVSLLGRRIFDALDAWRAKEAEIARAEELHRQLLTQRDTVVAEVDIHEVESAALDRYSKLDRRLEVLPLKLEALRKQCEAVKGEFKSAVVEQKGHLSATMRSLIGGHKFLLESALKKLGFNRHSIEAQIMDDELLREMGGHHDALSHVDTSTPERCIASLLNLRRAANRLTKQSVDRFGPTPDVIEKSA